MELITRTLYKLQDIKSKVCDLKKLEVFKDQKNIDLLYKFNQYLEDRTSIKMERLFKLRCSEIDNIIKKYDVKSIIEIGTGRTTFFFNLYNGVETTSYEQDAEWKLLIENFYNDEGLRVPDIQLENVIKYKNGGKFEKINESQCDLLYIDGPYVPKKGRHETFTGKPAYYDWETISKTQKPKIIMIEGRTDTADAILESDIIADYDFKGELTWALQRNKILHQANLKRHSVFTLKEARINQ